MKEKFIALINTINYSDEPNKYDDLQVGEAFFQCSTRYVICDAAHCSRLLQTHDTPL